MVRTSGIIFGMPSARPMSSMRIPGCCESRSTTCRSYFDSRDSSPSKSGCIIMALSLASFMPAGNAICITSPG